jgi:hypothetical protein
MKDFVFVRSGAAPIAPGSASWVTVIMGVEEPFWGGSFESHCINLKLERQKIREAFIIFTIQ